MLLWDDHRGGAALFGAHVETTQALYGLGGVDFPRERMASGKNSVPDTFKFTFELERGWVCAELGGGGLV